jgi:hypothetical protein
MERRAVVLRRDVRAGCFKEVPFGCRAVSQPNNSRAWRADSFLTFLTASSTVLMQDTLAGKLVWSKAVLCSAGRPTLLNFMGYSPHSFLRVQKIQFPEWINVKIEIWTQKD